MLYNAEVWPIKIQDIKALEGAHIRMMRRMMAFRERDVHISNEELFKAFKLPTIAELISLDGARYQKKTERPLSNSSFEGFGENRLEMDQVY